jgi:hypothetical protein
MSRLNNDISEQSRNATLSHTHATAAMASAIFSSSLARIFLIMLLLWASGSADAGICRLSHNDIDAFIQRPTVRLYYGDEECLTAQVGPCHCGDDALLLPSL